MTKVGHHLIIIALLLTFISQSMVALMMPCQHSTNTEGAMVAMHHPMAGMAPMTKVESTDHSLHMDHVNLPAKPQKTDCCKSFGHCPIGSCSLALGSEAVIFFTTLGSSISDLYNSTLPSIFTTALFRPPILR